MDVLNAALADTVGDLIKTVVEIALVAVSDPFQGPKRLMIVDAGDQAKAKN